MHWRRQSPSTPPPRRRRKPLAAIRDNLAHGPGRDHAMSDSHLLDALHRLRQRVRPEAGVGDAELLRRWVERRDEAAFEVLLWRHGPMVLGVCRRVLRDAHAA